MTSRQLLVGGLYALSFVSFLGYNYTSADDKPPADRWVQVSSVGFNVVELKKEIAIDAETAVKFFTNEFPFLPEDWERKLPGEVENAPDAAPIPDHVQDLWVPARNPMSYATVTGYSDNEVEVLILEHLGNYRHHNYFDCKARFRIPRSDEVDTLFDLAALQKKFGRVHKGLKHGDPSGKVIKTLGEPDAKIGYSPLQFFKLCYFKDDVIITINEYRVESIESPVPQSVKDEVKEKGPYLTRG